jgi:integrase
MGVKVKKRNGAWWVFVNHQCRRKAKKVGSEKAANDVATKLQAKLTLGDFSCLEMEGGHPKEPTFEEYANEWLELNPNG